MRHVFIRDIITLTLFFLLLASFTSCGKDHHTVEYNTIEEVQDDLDAVYFFDDGGTIEITQDQYNRVTVHVLDQLTSLNPENQTFGEHPRTNINDQFLSEDGTLYFSTNVNYNSGDLEHDTTGANITGTRRTDFTFSFENDELKVNIKVFSSQKNANVNFIVLNRTLTGVK